MPRSENAQIAVNLFDQIVERNSYSKDTCWKAIAALLLTCEVWESGWRPFKNVIVFREVNDFKKAADSSALMERARRLTKLVASELAFEPTDACARLGQYWQHPSLRNVQPHNPVGHAFRSLLVRALERFGDPEITYDEEVNPRDEFPGYDFGTRSKAAKIDIVARRQGRIVALVSSRWRFRHDRVDVVEEAMAYSPAAQRLNRRTKFYAWLGEFAPSRLVKVLDNCPPVHKNAAMEAAVHFCPRMLTEGLGENGRVKHLRNMAWLIDQTRDWQ